MNTIAKLAVSLCVLGTLAAPGHVAAACQGTQTDYEGAGPHVGIATTSTGPDTRVFHTDAQGVVEFSMQATGGLRWARLTAYDAHGQDLHTIHFASHPIVGPGGSHVFPTPDGVTRYELSIGNSVCNGSATAPFLFRLVET